MSVESSNIQLILHLRKKIVPISFVSFGIGIIVFIYLYSLPLQYKSNITIFNTNLSPDPYFQSNLPSANILIEGQEGKNIVNWVYSTDLINHLINKYNLKEHYNFHYQKGNTYENTFNKLQNSIRIEFTQFGAINIEVTDENRFIATDMANEIVNRIYFLNNDLMIKKRKFAIEQYSLMYNALEKTSSGKLDTLKVLIDEFSDLLIISGKMELKSKKLDKAQALLVKTAEEIQSGNNNLLESIKLQEWSKKYLEKANLPNYLIVKYAVTPPEINPINFQNIMISFWVLIISFLTISFFVLYKYRYNEGIQLLILGNGKVNGNNKGQIIFNPEIKTPINI